MCVVFYFLVNPIASSHFENAQQQNLTQNYSLHPNPMQVNHYDASFNSTNNFNNFDPSSNQFQYQFDQQTQQTSSTQYQAGGHLQQQNMYQQNMNNGPSTYQHTIDDLLVHQPTTNYQQTTNIYNSQEHIPAIQTHQSVSIFYCLIK